MSGTRHCPLLAIAVAIVLPLPAHAWTLALPWDPPTGEKPRLVHDPAGRPHMVFGGDHIYHAVLDPGGWRLEVVDPAPGLFDKTSLAIDPSGQPAITIGGRLRLARLEAGAWRIEDVGALTLGEVSLAFDRAGRPAIAYTDQGLMLASWDGDEWRHMTVDTTPPAGFLDLAFDSWDRPALAYVANALPRQVKLSRWDGTFWNRELIETIGVDSAFDDGALALAAPDRAWVSYYDRSVGLRLATWDGGAWRIDTIAASTNIVASSMRVSPLGEPWLAWYDANFQGTLLVASGQPPAVTVQAIETVGNASTQLRRSVCMDFDPAGVPAVAYPRMNRLDLRYARKEAADWSPTTVAGCGAALSASLAFDPSGVPQVAFVDGVFGTYPGTRIASYDRGAWSVGRRFGVAGWSLAFDPAGRPALLLRYQDGALAFSQWTGSAWSTETVERSPIQQARLVFGPDGQPLIAYTSDPGVLKLARRQGGSWTAEEVDGAFRPGCSLGLALDAAGRPLVSYRGPGYEVRVARWSGAAWSIDELDATGQGPGHSTSIALDGLDRPAVLWEDDWVELRLARWDGSSWAIETVDRPTAAGISCPTLALDELDRPVIAGSGTTEARIISWNGSAWTEEALDPGNLQAATPSIARRADGRLAVAWVDGRDDSLKLAWFDLQILRGPSVPALAPVAREELPWTDPEPVLDAGFPALLCYQSNASRRIAAVRSGTSVRLVGF